MATPNHQISVKRVQRIAITIPANTGDGSKLRTLLAAAGLTLGGSEELVGVQILPRKADGTDRLAIALCDVATDATFDTHAQHVAAGEAHYEPAVGDADSYVRAMAGAAVDAVALAYID